MKVMRKMPVVQEMREQYALTPNQQLARQLRIQEVEKILSGKDQRKLICIGPCSADREDAVLEYMCRLAVLQDKVADRLLFVPRVYTSKPRTTGSGYKGMLHRAQAENDEDNIAEGVVAARRLHLSVIKETGFFCVDEMLYPEMFSYVSDLLAYAAVGARSVEDQGHRLAASNLDVPVGLKNPINGDLITLLHSLQAAQQPQPMVQEGYEVRSDGNSFAHAILRGYVDNGIHRPNYHYEDLSFFYDNYQKAGLKNIGVVVDCNHSNSGKNSDEQPRIAREVMRMLHEEDAMRAFVKGLMIESYLQDGKQLVGGTTYGKSVTDACLGWNKTERLIEELYLLLGK